MVNAADTMCTRGGPTADRMRRFLVSPRFRSDRRFLHPQNALRGWRGRWIIRIATGMTEHPDTAAAQPKRDMAFREFVMLCACLMAMNALSIDPMLPALPDIGRDLSVPHPNDRQLIISVYFLGLGVGSLLFGVLSDRYGRQREIGRAMALFILSSIACAGAHSFAMMLAARACAGFFAGARSEEHTSELQSLMRISYAVFCLKKKNKK